MSEQNQTAESEGKTASVGGQNGSQEWLSTREVCNYLGISRRTLQNWVKKGAISVSQVHTVYGVENRYRVADLEGLRKGTPATSQVIKGSFTGGEMTGKIETFFERLESLEKLNDRLDTLIKQQEILARSQEMLAAEQRRANDLKEAEIAQERRRLETKQQGFAKRLLGLGSVAQRNAQTATKGHPTSDSGHNKAGAGHPSADAYDATKRQGLGARGFVAQLLRLLLRVLEEDAS